MQLLGQPITHTTFGKGIVTDWNDHIITVCFNSGEKRFIYPDAFSNFLILKNTNAQEKIQHLIDESEENHKAKLHVPFDSVPRRGIGGLAAHRRHFYGKRRLFRQRLHRRHHTGAQRIPPAPAA